MEGVTFVQMVPLWMIACQSQSMFLALMLPKRKHVENGSIQAAPVLQQKVVKLFKTY